MGVKRLRAGAAVVLLTVLLAGLLPAAAGATGIREIRDFACPPDSVPAAGYGDTAHNVHAAAIDCLAWYGITRGTGGGYEPAATISRGQMAAFLVRLLDHVDPRLLAPSNGNRFTDVGHSHAFVTEINRLAQAGVVAGGPGALPPSQYGPALPVSRAQMASFLTRAHRLVTGTGLSARRDCFSDDDGNPHEVSINALCAAGIAAGRPGGAYSPNEAVRRDAMASFLMRVVDVLVEDHHTTPPGAARSTLTLENPSLTAGEQLEGAIVGRGISGVTVDGCGFAPGTAVTLDSAGAFSLEVPANHTGGTCAVTFRVGFSGGAFETHEHILSVRPRNVTVASLAVTPTADAVTTTSGGTDATRGLRVLTVSGTTADGRRAAGAVVDLRLVDAGAASLAASGAPFFAGGAGGDAALTGASRAVVVAVDGQAQPANTRTVDGARLGSDGALTVSISATGPDDVRLVAFADPANDNAIKIAADGTPAGTEVAAASGRTTILPPPSSSANVSERGLVTYVDKSGQRLGLVVGAANGSSPAVSRTDRLYAFDGNDQYRVGGARVTHGAFIAALSRADVLRVGPYGASSSDVSVFDIVTDNPQPPTVGARTASTPGTVTVTVTGTNPQQLAAYDRFIIQRAPVSGGTAGSSNGTVGAWATVGGPTRDADVFVPGFQFAETGVPSGMYRYRAAAVLDAQQSAFSSGTANLAVGFVGPRPLSLSLRVAVDNGAGGSGSGNGTLDQGDRLVAAFDQAMAVAPGWEIRLLDRDGTVARLDSSRAAVAVGGSGRKQVTIDLTAAPQIVVNGTNANVNLTTGGENYVQVLSATGITGTGGTWNLPASGVPGKSPTRTFVGGNARHPAAPTAVSTDPGTSTVTIGAGSNVQDGEAVFVYDSRGEQIGQGTKGAGATTITASPAFGPGQVLYVVYRDSVGGPNSEALSRSLKVTTQSLTVTGISPASGTKAGGTTMTITGSGFNGTTVKAGSGCTVLIGGVCVTSVSSVTATSFQAVTPASAVVDTDLAVQVSGVTNNAVRFTYTNSPPTVIVTSEPGAVAAGETATYSGAASDPDGALSKVEVQVRQGMTVVAAWATTPSGPTPWSWTSDTLSTGTYTFEFRAVDDLGAMSAVVAKTLVVA